MDPLANPHATGSPGEGSTEGDTSDLGTRDSEVLRVIEREELSSFSFEGLKRRTGVHPETLSRTLDRLEDRNVVERMGGAYRLTSQGKQWLGVHPSSDNDRRLSLVRTLTPPSVSLGSVYAGLRGRWFGQLRWLGHSEVPGGMVLKWVTADGGLQLDARFLDGELVIEGRLLRGEDLAEAVNMSHLLMAQISRAFSTPRPKHVLMYTPSPSYMNSN